MGTSRRARTITTTRRCSRRTATSCSCRTSSSVRENRESGRSNPLTRPSRTFWLAASSMLLEAGSDDGTVDPRQASLFYNYARRAGKDVVLLMYPGEGHGLAKKENQIDYERRILQWFAHYLKGDPAAPWITEGQRALERR